MCGCQAFEGIEGTLEDALGPHLRVLRTRLKVCWGCVFKCIEGVLEGTLGPRLRALKALLT